jgi:hypothetical protein
MQALARGLSLMYFLLLTRYDLALGYNRKQSLWLQQMATAGQYGIIPVTSSTLMAECLCQTEAVNYPEEMLMPDYLFFGPSGIPSFTYELSAS